LIHESVANLLRLSPKLTDYLAPHQIQRAEELLRSIPEQLSTDDIRALVSLLPGEGGTAFGLNWTIVHAIEASPDWPLWDALRDPSNEWVRMLLQSLANAGIHPPPHW
jgi:hypothetical protein